jgi:hypothetical protein
MWMVVSRAFALGSTAATYPALPPAMEELVPAMLFVAVSVTAAESPSDGIEDLFGFEWIDRMFVTGPSTPQP